MGGSGFRGNPLHSPAAQILETALALQRAPGERFRLRERPLPPGIVHAIEVAAGSSQTLLAASEELGEPETALVEAARFYLEQVLFADPGADAYRVLGLSPDATPEAIRTHHRWLQRWLHPDRAQAGDASVFATRVNQAFAQLRSPEARHAYDVQLAEARLSSASATLAPETVHHWEHADDTPRHGRRSRWLLAAALAACVVLVVLIVRNPDRSAQWNPEEGAEVAAREDSGPAIEDRDLGVLGAALAAAPQPGSPGSTAARPATSAQTAAPSHRASKPATHANPLRALVAAALHPLRNSQEPRGHGIVSAASTLPAMPQPSRAAIAMPAAAESATTPVTALPPARTDPQSIAAVSPPAAPAVPPVAASPTPAPPPAPSVRPEDAALVAARLPLAEQRVAQLAGYLASRPNAVPLWDNVQAMAETNQARQRINARKGSKLELGRPAWRMRPEQATLRTDYRCRSGNDAPCGGRLEITLVWREGLWLVRGVSLGPSA